ncbi:MAG: LamG-like jellyroll fold domain-containing protein [Bacteroidota bacterium]
MIKILPLLSLGLLYLSLAFAQPPNTQNALHFDGVNDFIQTTFPGITGTAPRTIEAWIKTTANANPNNGGVQQIITDWGVFATGSRFTFNVLWNNAIRLEVSGSGLSGSIAVNDGLWHYVVGVYDPTASNQLSLYVDGVLDVSGNIPTPINTALGNMRIGQRVDGARHFDGTIDEIRVWDIALSPSQVAANFNQALCSLTGVVAYYKFDEGIAGGTNTGITNLPDLVANNNGTLQNFALNGSTSNWVQGVALTLGTGTTSTINATSCGPYTSPSGNFIFTTSGTYADTIVNAAGCDSILSINLNIAGTSFDTITETACDFYTTPSGQTLLGSGTFQDTIANAAGCDSVITINLTVNSNTGSVISEIACGSYTSPSGMNTWSVSGTYQDVIPNSAGCDSTITINLVIGMSSTETIFETACDSFISPSGNYVWTSSGSYLDTVSNAAGCDSILIVGLQINNSTASTIPIVSCGPYTSPSGNFTYTSSGTYQDTVPNQEGCFEYLTLNVSIVEIDTAVVQVNRDLTAQATGVSYQWLDCNNNFAPILAANQQTFVPDDPGSYAVEISDNGCVDTSACFTVSSGLSIANHSFESELSAYPNPSSDRFVIELGDRYEEITYQLFNLNGQMVLDKRSTLPIAIGRHKINLDLANYPSGIYLLQLKADGRSASIKLRLQ